MRHSPLTFIDVRQSSPVEGVGLVRVAFIADEEEESWRSLSLKKLTRDIEYLQQNGIPPGDIAILVRRNEEGQDIAAHLLEYKHSAEAKTGVNYEVVSNESLRIEGLHIFTFNQVDVIESWRQRMLAEMASQAQ